MDSFIETFHIDWKIIIAQGINFIIVLFVLFFLVVKPLKKLMKERSTNIANGLNDAKVNAELLLNTKKEYDEVLSKARNEANVIFQEGKKEAETKKMEMLENAKKEVDNMIANGKKVLESEKAKIIEEAKKEIVSLVVLSTEKLLESNGDEKFENKAINQIKKI
ncbi:MAG TPA: F0F1 ATP synthase subunit B [Candidatus Paceibacterota bacterium]|nr:F0F1 ATP synthase subunit B [Candidatus Paceibacterota bacterium]